MGEYEKALEVMKELFSKDFQFALATASDNVPSLRYVDTYFDGSDFYIVTYATSRKVKEISSNPNVALCARSMHAFSGKAYNVGHPLLDENKFIREKLIKVFEPWYFAHNNEKDKNMCYVKVVPETGFFYKDGIGYKVNFAEKVVETFPFEFEIVVTEE